MIDITPPYDAGDEGQVGKKKTKVQIREEQEKEDLRNILLTPGGRRFLWKKLKECRLYKISFTGDNMTIFHEGKRQIGLRLIEDIFAADPNAFLEMHIEAASRNKGKIT